MFFQIQYYNWKTLTSTATQACRDIYSMTKLKLTIDSQHDYEYTRTDKIITNWNTEILEPRFFLRTTGSGPGPKLNFNFSSNPAPPYQNLGFWTLRGGVLILTPRYGSAVVEIEASMS